MSSATNTLLRPLGFGEILDGAFIVYRRHFGVLFASALIGGIPLSIGSSFLAVSLQGPAPTPGDVLAAIGGLSILLLGSMFLSAVLTRQIAGALRGGVSSVADGYKRALRRLLPLILAYLIIALAVFAVVFIAAIVIGTVAAGLGIAAAMRGGLEGGGPAGQVLVPVLAASLLTMSGAFVLAVFVVSFAVVPAVIVEDLGAVASIGRSWRLARGAFLRIAGVTIVAYIILLLPSFGFAVLGAVGFSSLSPLTDVAALTTRGFIAQQMLSMFTSALTWPFYVACITLLYFDRRVRTEAFDLEAAADALAVR